MAKGESLGGDAKPLPHVGAMGGADCFAGNFLAVVGRIPSTLSDDREAFRNPFAASAVLR